MKGWEKIRNAEVLLNTGIDQWYTSFIYCVVRTKQPDVGERVGKIAEIDYSRLKDKDLLILLISDSKMCRVRSVTFGVGTYSESQCERRDI